MRLGTVLRGRPTAVIVRDGNCQPVVELDSGAPYADVGAILRDGARGSRALDLAAAAATGSGFVLDDAQLLRPVLEPSAVFCVGLNYPSHRAELDRPVPTAPVWFDKLGRSLADPGRPLAVSDLTQELDFEAELALVIGVEAKNVRPDRAWEIVAGVTLINDVSARDLQRDRRQVFLGKNLDASTPLGPLVASLDEIGEFATLEFNLSVNGELRQTGCAGEMLFDVPALLADLSRTVTLRPGDVVATGTPAGVAMTEESPRWLREGDRVEIECAPIGRLSNTIE